MTTINLLDKAVDTFSVLYSTINTIIGLMNDNDVSNLQTVNKTSLVAAINEVNSKSIPFYEKDNLTKTHINLEVAS